MLPLPPKGFGLDALLLAPLPCIPRSQKNILQVFRQRRLDVVQLRPQVVHVADGCFIMTSRTGYLGLELSFNLLDGPVGTERRGQLFLDKVICRVCLLGTGVINSVVLKRTVFIEAAPGSLSPPHPFRTGDHIDQIHFYIHLPFDLAHLNAVDQPG